MTENIVRTGHSLAVVVPSSFVRRLGIQPKDKVKLIVDEAKGRITYVFSNRRQLPLV